MLSIDPGWPHPNRCETDRQVARAVEEERKGVVELDRAKMTETRPMERVKEGSETGKHRTESRNPMTETKAEVCAGASKAEVLWKEAMEARWPEPEPGVAKAEVCAGASKAEVVREEATEPRWPEPSMAEVSAPASKAEVPTPSLRENVG